MTALRIVLLIVVAFVFGCGIGAAILALWAYWETESRYESIGVGIRSHSA